MDRLAHRDRIALAGGELVGAAFRFLGEVVSGPLATPPDDGVVESLRARLSECIEEDGSAKPRLTVTLPDRPALDRLAETLARLMAAGRATPKDPERVDGRQARAASR